MELIRGFGAFSRTDLVLAGGKGANLGDMVQVGPPVPPGFVLLTPAYRAFVAANQLQAEVEQISAGAPQADPIAVEAASAAIRALFDRYAMPEAVGAAVLAAYRQWGAGAWPCALRRRLKTCPGPRLPASRTPISTLTARNNCWRRSSAAGPRAGAGTGAAGLSLRQHHAGAG